MNSTQAVELLKKLISTPSFSCEENEAANIMEDALRNAGYSPQRKGNNVWAHSHNADPALPTILLDAHIDTVRPAEGWNTDPFTPTVSGGKLYGLGSNDTGGSVVSMLAAFIALDSTKQPYNLIYSASAQEENTGKEGVQSIVSQLPMIELAIVGEPTGMHPAVAEMGLFVVDCTAHGKAGHAARNEGVNALYKAIENIAWFQTYKFERVSPMLGAVKMTVTGIEAGTLHNVVPDKCRFTVDIRVNECYTNKQIHEQICRSVDCTVTPRSFTLNSSSISVDHPAVKRLVGAGRTPYASPTTSNQAVLPYTSLKLGPGDSARSHTANEYIRICEIEEAIGVYVAMLDNLIL